jgi:hypothetical protein
MIRSVDVNIRWVERCDLSVHRLHVTSDEEEPLAGQYIVGYIYARICISITSLIPP